MKIRPSSTDSGYMQKSSAVSWADALTQTPTTNGDLGDFTYLYLGKRMHIVNSTPHPEWHLWQSFLRFDCSGIRDSDAIDAATLRLWVATDGSDTDITVRCRVLTATYGTLESTDWDAAGTNLTTISTSAVATDAASGVKYLDISFTAAMLASVTATNAVLDIRIANVDQTGEPTGDAYLQIYSPAHGTATLRPYLKVTTRNMRQQVIDAVVAELAAISAFSGYNVTPTTVSSQWKPIGGPTFHAGQFPVIQVYDADETREPFTFQASECSLALRLQGAVWRGAKADIVAAVNELVADIVKALEADIASMRLGLVEIHTIEINKVHTSADFVIDDNRGYGIVDITVRYRHTMNET